MSFPYSYVSCSCIEAEHIARRIGAAANGVQAEEEQEEKTFDPRSPRANFSLSPLDHLVWCEDCNDIRCERCVISEICYWYCPSCLFEVPSSMVKSEGNRCTRNCFNCPICTAPMTVNTLDADGVGVAGSWILACDYCNWTTLDIGIEFDKPTNVFSQLVKLRQERMERAPSKRSAETEEPLEAPPTPNPAARFDNLKAFYKSQLSSTISANPLMSPSSEFNYNSPSSLARIMNLYTGTGTYGKKTPSKPSTMRESADLSEGLSLVDPEADQAVMRKIQARGWHGTASLTQQADQVSPSRFLADLWPVPTLLRTKKAKRCRACRHILVKPETKIQSTRYKLKLTANNYVPNLSLQPLQAPSLPPIDLEALQPSKPLQFLLLVKNPLFVPVKVTLATPAQTPGRFPSTVTMLCPQFEVGANIDVWDDALGAEGGRQSSRTLKAKSGGGPSEGRIAEAGKVWDMGGNWTAVVVEVVCARIRTRDGELAEDEDVFEIPVFVRTEYEAEVTETDPKALLDDGTKEKRELAYWCVLGIGRIVKTVE
ncbi:hypothetical protein MMC26_003651 [Xylographa opegraphella]|nr:hypothetical protein [Xylographa opegraphella]